jgi:molybdopterin synthase sulfur carrier subunit
MPVRVQIPASMRPLTGGVAELEADAGSVAVLIETLGTRYPGITDRLCEGNGELRRYVRVFVNEEDVRFLRDRETPLASGDTVAIVPAVAGG